MIPMQIPTVYFEGYHDLVNRVKTLPWPSKPKAIFTCNAHDHDDAFKLWAAIKTEIGVPLVIGQHGGSYGVSKRVCGEDHQVAIADRYLTWGWQDSRKNVFPAFAFTDVRKKQQKWNKDGNLLLITGPISRYSWISNSLPVSANQSNRFINTQLKFAELLPDNIRTRLVVRLRSSFDKNQKTSYGERWIDAHPEITIDPSTESLPLVVHKNRLFVSGFNTTAHNYSLSRNIPTILFWDPEYWELRLDAQPYFDRFKQVGIFHDTPESAAAKVKEIWDNVGDWWFQEEIQSARREFCEQYVHMSSRPFRVLKEALRQA
jgi:putative transferase (TIGR04331 family)